ncbi:DUF1264 domain-containing protein [Streptomyces spiralis]|nr:DUF1264 domain-containing protein [Streptomyces spiralis]
MARRDRDLACRPVRTGSGSGTGTGRPARPADVAAPGVPDMAEPACSGHLVTTYGKTFHTWQYDREDFPYGIPQLMMGLTGDGQAVDEMIRARDDRLGVSTSRKRQNRADIPMPEVAPGANAWESGRTVQTRVEEMDFKR